MRTPFLCFSLSAVILISGCSTTLESSPLMSNGKREGIAYVLPFTQWTITSTWRLDYCPDPDDLTLKDGKDAAIALKVEAVAQSEDDGKLAFIVNPQDLQSLTSITTFGVRWHEGRNTLAAINVSGEDRSAQIVGNVAKTAVKVFSLTAGSPTGSVLAPSSARAATVLCQENAAKALDAAEKAKAVLQVRKSALKKANADLVAIAKKADAVGDAIDDSTKLALSTAFDAVVKASLALEGAEEDLIEATKKISFSRVDRWPQDGDTFSGGPIRIEPAKVAAWLQSGLNASSDSGPSVIYLQIERTGNFGRKPDIADRRPRSPGTSPSVDTSNRTIEERGDPPYVTPAESSKGLRYRVPAKGVLVVCSKSPCSLIDQESYVASFEGPIAQLGYVNVLPFRTRSFGSNAFTAEMNIDGSLKSVGYEQKVAPAEAATGAIADTTAQVAAALDPTARLQAENAYLKALKERRDLLEELSEKVDSEKVSALDAEGELMSARFERLNAEIFLEEIRSKGD